MATTATSDLTATAATSAPGRRGPNIGRILAWIFMGLVVCISLFPFYWMLRTALSSNSAIYAGANSLLPVQFSWGGFERVFGLQTPRSRWRPAARGKPSTSRATS